MDTARRNSQNSNRRPRNTNTNTSNININSSRRSKSRSPSRGLRNDPFASLNSSMTMARISTGTRSLKSTGSSSVRHSTSSFDTDFVSDAGQRLNTSTVKNNSSTPSAAISGLQKREKGKERQLKSHDAVEPAPTFSGSLAAAEFERMRREIESLKNNLNEQRKISKKQAKKIEELKTEVISSKETRNEQEAQFQSLKLKQSRNEHVLSAIETSLACNICMELLDKPYSIAPCGHMFCLRDLQNWFRTAPPTDDDMDVDADDPEYIKYRRKSCPTCRAAVTGRPIPVFIVKDVIATLKMAKASDSGDIAIRRSTSPYISGDPWEGLFPNDSEFEGEEEEEEDDALGALGFGILYSDTDDSEVEMQYDDSEYESDGEPIEEEGIIDVDEEEEESDEEEIQEDLEEYSDEEEDDSEVSYVSPSWEPAFFRDYSEIDEIPHTPHQLPLLRRGCPPWLLRTYRMRYSHQDGLVAHLNSLDADDVGVPLHGSSSRMHRIFIGWNLPDVEDQFSEFSGMLFMRKTLEDYKRYPHRFLVNERPNGCLDVRGLVRTDQINEYETTDSE